MRKEANSHLYASGRHRAPFANLSGRASLVIPPKSSLYIGNVSHNIYQRLKTATEIFCVVSGAQFIEFSGTMCSESDIRRSHVMLYNTLGNSSCQLTLDFFAEYKP
jgi:hypothetical protein